MYRLPSGAALAVAGAAAKAASPARTSLRCVALARGLHATAQAQALSKFSFPAMSPTMTEGGISSWKKSEGETFAPGDVLLEIETDKATMDVEAQEEGKLVKVLVGDGTKGVPVGSTIAIVAEDGDEYSQSDVDKLVSSADEDGGASEESEGGDSKAPETPKKDDKSGAPKGDEPPAPKSDESSMPKEDSKPTKAVADDSTPKPTSPPKEESSGPPRDHIFASPIAKRLALEKGIPLSKLKGTGPNGRIVKADIESYKPEAAAPAPVAAPSASKSASAPAPSKGGAAPSSAARPPASESTTPPYTDTPLSAMRRVIASRLTESKQGAPHYYVTGEITMDRVLKLREVFNQAAAAGGRDGVSAGVKLSVNDFVVKACALALQAVPEVNASWLGESIRQYHRVDISVAVATPTGLITPIVTDAASKGLASISTLTKELAKKARDGKLQPQEYQGGSFTISNLGMFGSVSEFTAIINAPQSAILAVAGTEDKLVLDPESERGFKSSKVMRVTLSCDHRVIDGATAAKWMKALKDLLENPLSFML